MDAAIGLSMARVSFAQLKNEERWKTSYTDYEKDHTAPYTAVLDCRADSNAEVPEGMASVDIPGGTYTLDKAKGSLTEGSVFSKWTDILNNGLPRTCLADYEVYGEKAHDSQNPEVENGRNQ
jgi:predicted transcriptional regulator YdeE